MSTWRGFPTTNGPSTPASYSLGSPFISGMGFAVHGAGYFFEGYWWWVCATGQSTSPVECALWSITGGGTGEVIPASEVTSGTLTAGQWNWIPLETPILLAASYDANLSTNGSEYVAAIGCNGPFPITTNYFNEGDVAAAGITNGPLNIYSGTTGSKPAPYANPQGTFSATGSNPSTTCPMTPDSSGDHASNLWVDVQITDVVPAGFTGPWDPWANKFDANAVTGEDSEVAYCIGTTFQLSETLSDIEVKFFSPSTATGLPTFAGIWSIPGATTESPVLENTSPTWSGSAGSGWVTCSLTGTLAAGTYAVAVYNSNGGSQVWGPKDASSAYFDLGIAANGITCGPITYLGLSASPAAYEFNSGDGSATPPYSSGSISHGQPLFSQPATGLTMPVIPYLWAPVTANTDESNTIHTQNYWTGITGTADAPVQGSATFSATADFAVTPFVTNKPQATFAATAVLNASASITGAHSASGTFSITAALEAAAKATRRLDGSFVSTAEFFVSVAGSDIRLTPSAFGFFPGSAGVDITPTDQLAFPSTSETVSFYNYYDNMVAVVYNGTEEAITVTPQLIRGVQGQTPDIPSSSVTAGKCQAFGPFDHKDYGTLITLGISAEGNGVTVLLVELTEA